VKLAHCCRLFGISRQGIYQSHQRALFRQKELEQIKALVLNIRMRMPRIGTRKLYYILKQEFDKLNIKIGRDALFNYLRAEHLLIKPLKSYTKTTNSHHWFKKHPNLMKDVKADKVEQFFVSDITFLKSKQAVHFLSLVTDAYSRKIMGYNLSNDMTAESVVKALRNAAKNKITNNETIHHSDRGFQYCSSLYQQELVKNKIKPSMTDGYDCYQNAIAERVNGILKQEFLVEKCNNKQELEQIIKESINIYNGERPHTNLNMKTPNFVHEIARINLSPEPISII